MVPGNPADAFSRILDRLERLDIAVFGEFAGVIFDCPAQFVAALFPVDTLDTDPGVSLLLRLLHRSIGHAEDLAVRAGT